MATMPTCDGPDDDQAAFMITNIPEAETSALCLHCMADFSLAYLMAVAPDRLKPPAAPRQRAAGKKQAAAAAAAAANGQDEASDPAPPARQAARVD